MNELTNTSNVSNYQISPLEDKLKNLIITKKEKAALAYSQVIDGLSQKGTIQPSQLRIFYSSILILYAELEGLIEKDKSQGTLVKLKQYSRNPLKIMRAAESTHELTLINEFIDFYFKLNEYLVKYGFSDLTEAKIDFVQLLEVKEITKSDKK